MPMISTDKQEQLSLAVLHATCAKAGFGFQISGRIQDNWGFDATVDVKEKIDAGSTLWDFRMKMQIKSTRQQLTLAQNRHSFPLEIQYYDHLRAAANCDAPTFLVVFQMPQNEDDWVHCSADNLILRHCLRWVSLRGAKEVDTAKPTVYFPHSHVLTPDALRKLAKARSLEQWINYDQTGAPHADHA